VKGTWFSDHCRSFDSWSREFRLVRLQPALIGSYRTLADLGAGFGHYAETLREHADYLVGLDAFVPALQMAKRKKVFHDLIRADILHLPLHSQSVNCVTLLDVIEHLSKNDGEKLLASLEPSVFVSTPCFHFSNKIHARLLGNALENHVSRWSLKQFEDMGYEAGTRDPPLWMSLLGNKGILFAYKLRSNKTSGRAVKQD
jgi:2-polyprenyl-3-methyl-5-hydroxy-6-metoxy-1,4-benzoquinol methylase